MSKTVKMEKAELDENGHEVVSNVPMQPPLGYKKEPSVSDRIREMVRSEMLRREAIAAGVETMEEADDFDIADDPVDPSTPFEENFDPPPQPEERLTEEEWSERERKRYTSDEYKKLRETRAPPVGGASPISSSEGAAAAVPPAAGPGKPSA